MSELEITRWIFSAVYAIGMIVTMYLAHRFWIKRFPNDSDLIAEIGFSFLVSLVWFIVLPIYVLFKTFYLIDDLRKDDDDRT